MLQESFGQAARVSEEERGIARCGQVDRKTGETGVSELTIRQKPRYWGCCSRAVVLSFEQGAFPTYIDDFLPEMPVIVRAMYTDAILFPVGHSCK